MMENSKILDVQTDVKKALEKAIAETGGDLKVSAETIAALTAASAARLSASVGMPGHDEAVIAERDVIAITAALEASASGKALDQRVMGIVSVAIALGARVLNPALDLGTL